MFGHVDLVYDSGASTNIFHFANTVPECIGHVPIIDNYRESSSEPLQWAFGFRIDECMSQ